MRNKYLVRPLSVALVMLISVVLTGCGAATPITTYEPDVASIASMPDEVQSAPVRVQQAYQFAVANPHILKQLPCYCGCDQMGHTDNYMCYVKAVDANGAVEYDNHAVGCLICVDITQDAMRMRKSGKSVAEMKAYVDATYSKFGPSNMDD